MARRPEIGNIQLYPDRPLRKSDRNGYVLKFYCPIQGKRIRRNCGTRDRREARKILRECRERLLNGTYVGSNGAITAEHQIEPPTTKSSTASSQESESKSWDECYQRYVEHRRPRVRERSLDDAISRLGIAERVLQAYVDDFDVQGGLTIANLSTLDAMEHLQERLLAGDECRFDERSPSTVNSMMGAVMAFVRFCQARNWIDTVPPVEKLDVDEAMKGRPITMGEFQQMLDAVPGVIGASAASSWQFTLQVLWGSAFRVGDVMDFSWDDPRHIHPVWGRVAGQHPTIAIPSSQKNGKVQEIPMLPELIDLLDRVPVASRNGWVVSPESSEFDFCGDPESFHPCDSDMRSLLAGYRNTAIARACKVSEASVRKWRQSFSTLKVTAKEYIVPQEMIELMSLRASRTPGQSCRNATDRMTKERVSRVIARIGKAAGIVVQLEDPRLNKRQKFASAHDIRRGVAQRLINQGVSAETLKVVMRHKDFVTTEKHYSAVRSAQSAAAEIASKILRTDRNSELVGGLMGGHEKTPQLNAEELSVLKALLTKL